MEVLFHYVRKLLEANAEVAFATGAEFVSIQVTAQTEAGS
jgi:hypothetical protein